MDFIVLGWKLIFAQGRHVGGFESADVRSSPCPAAAAGLCAAGEGRGCRETGLQAVAGSFGPLIVRGSESRGPSACSREAGREQAVSGILCASAWLGF